MATFCRKCGTSLAEGAAFCRTCGTPRASSASALADQTPAAPASGPAPIAAGAPVTAPIPAAAWSAPPTIQGAQAAGAEKGTLAGRIGVAAAALLLIVVIAAGGFFAWRTGLPDKLLPKGGGEVAAGSTVSTGESSGASSGGTSGPLSQKASYDALVAEWDGIRALSREYGEPTPGAASGIGTGYLYDTGAKRIGLRDSSERVKTRDVAKEWVDRFTKARSTFADKGIAATHSTSKAELLAIYDLMIKRADVYYRTAAYAVDNPSVGSKQPWRTVQSGEAVSYTH